MKGWLLGGGVAAVGFVLLANYWSQPAAKTHRVKTLPGYVSLVGKAVPARVRWETVKLPAGPGLPKQAIYAGVAAPPGNATVFNMPRYPLAPGDFDPVVTINGKPVQIGIEGLDSSPGAGCGANTVYIDYAKHDMRFCDPPALSQQIKVVYWFDTNYVTGLCQPQPTEALQTACLADPWKFGA